MEKKKMMFCVAGALSAIAVIGGLYGISAINSSANNDKSSTSCSEKKKGFCPECGHPLDPDDRRNDPPDVCPGYGREFDGPGGHRPPDGEPGGPHDGPGGPGEHGGPHGGPGGPHGGPGKHKEPHKEHDECEEEDKLQINHHECNCPKGQCPTGEYYYYNSKSPKGE